MARAMGMAILDSPQQAQLGSGQGSALAGQAEVHVTVTVKIGVQEIGITVLVVLQAGQRCRPALDRAEHHPDQSPGLGHNQRQVKKTVFAAENFDLESVDRRTAEQDQRSCLLAAVQGEEFGLGYFPEKIGSENAQAIAPFITQAQFGKLSGRGQGQGEERRPAV